MTEEQFLEKFIFYDLEDRNDGFDKPNFKYFDEEDFETVMSRAEEAGLVMLGIECWVQKKIKTTKYMEDYDEADDWHRQAYKDLRREGFSCLFSATYDIPPQLLRD